jgi:hypothetical protein
MSLILVEVVAMLFTALSGCEIRSDFDPQIFCGKLFCVVDDCFG